MLIENRKVWDTQTGEVLHTLQHNHIVRAVAFPNQPNPQVLATGGMEKKLRIFDLSQTATASTTNGTSIPSYEIGAGVHGGTIKSIVWGSDLNIIVTAAEDKKIRWWDLRERERPIAEFAVDGVIGTCELDTAGATPGSPGILSVAAGKNVYFFDGAQPASLIKHIKMPHEVSAVALHAQQRKFVCGSASDTWVHVWDFDEEKEIGVYTNFHHWSHH